MGNWLFDSGSRVLETVSTIAALIGLAVVVVQQVQSRRLIEAQTRPYIYISCRRLVRNAKSMVALDIKNSGNSPAYDLQITALDNEPFHSLNGSSKLPFVSTSASMTVLPGQRLTYLIGTAAKGSTFALSKGKDIPVTVTYRGQTKGKAYSEDFVLSLSSASFLVESAF